MNNDTAVMHDGTNVTNDDSGIMKNDNKNLSRGRNMLKGKELDALIEQRGVLKGLNSTLGITAITMTVFFILYAILLGKTASDQFLGSSPG